MDYIDKIIVDVFIQKGRIKVNLKAYKKLLFAIVTGTVLITSSNRCTISFAQEKVEEYNDETFIDYLNDLKEETIEYLNSKEVEENKEKIIDNFIIVVDFIYFDGEIKGVKFDDLKDSTKEEVYQILSILDENIENKIPNYKDNLEEKYNKVKNKIVEKIDEVNQKIDDDETLSEIKDKTIEGLTEIKDITKNEYETVKKYVKKWYFDLKDKH